MGEGENGRTKETSAMNPNGYTSYDSLRELHYAHYSRDYRPRWNIVAQRHADIRMILVMRDWMRKDAETEGETIVTRRIGVN